MEQSLFQQKAGSTLMEQKERNEGAPLEQGGLGAATVRGRDRLGPAGPREEAGLTGKNLIKCISSKFG